jgi:hypothetical protein
MAFKEGPGYKFTNASFLKVPPHSVSAKASATKFLYMLFKGYKGQDSYAIKICAIRWLLVPDLYGGCAIIPTALTHPTGRGHRCHREAATVRNILRRA